MLTIGLVMGRPERRACACVHVRERMARVRSRRASDGGGGDGTDDIVDAGERVEEHCWDVGERVCVRARVHACVCMRALRA